MRPGFQVKMLLTKWKKAQQNAGCESMWPGAKYCTQVGVITCENARWEHAATPALLQIKIREHSRSKSQRHAAVKKANIPPGNTHIGRTRWQPSAGDHATGYCVSRKVRDDGETPAGYEEQVCRGTTGTMVQSGEETAVGTHDNHSQIHKRLPQTGREYIFLTHGD